MKLGEDHFRMRVVRVLPLGISVMDNQSQTRLAADGRQLKHLVVDLPTY